MLRQLPHVKPATVGQVFKRVFTAAGEIYETPASWKNHVVRFYADVGDGYMVFGPSVDLAIDKTTVSSYNAGTKKLTGSPASSAKNLLDRSFIDVFVGPNDNFFMVVGEDDLVGHWTAHVADHGRSVI